MYMRYTRTLNSAVAIKREIYVRENYTNSENVFDYLHAIADKAIASSKNRKAPGSDDDIPSDLIKYGSTLCHVQTMPKNLEEKIRVK